MWRLGLLLLAACAPVDQDSVTVAAIEVPLRSDADRSQLLHLFQKHATAAGLHVDDGSAKWRAFEAQSQQIAPKDRLTFNVGIWRGADDNEIEALADDRFHPGRVWLTFPRGVDPARSANFRGPLIAELRALRPDVVTVPVLPSGGVPLANDVILEGETYKVKRTSAATYDLALNSPLVAR